MMPQCPGTDCPLKNTCSLYAEKLDKTKMFWDKPPYNSEKKRCAFYTGYQETALLEHVRDILKRQN